MKKLTLLLVLILSFIIVTGCQTGKTTKSASEDSITPTEVFQLIESASEKENAFYNGKYTQEEVYAYFKSYYTKDYIDTIILGGGNLKLEQGYWSLAYIGSEFIEGTYYSGGFDDTTEVVHISDKMIKVSHSYGDGLYAPHIEHITLIKAEEGWLIHQLEWEWRK